MRSYRQYCAVAKALDLVGDRWTLLIVRELLLGPCRYTDLQRGLPGIATNLLADRLREMEEADVVRREEAGPPIGTTVFRLTPRGEDLKPVIQALATWGAPMMAEIDDTDRYQSSWLAILVALFASEDLEPDEPPIAIEVRAGGDPLIIEVGGDVRTRRGRTDNPDAVVTGPANLVAGLLFGGFPLAVAIKRGLTYEGDPYHLARIQPMSRSDWP